MNKISFAHSPDCDDAFMYYGIASGGIETGTFDIKQITKDIEKLNNEAKESKYEITAISFAAYPAISEQYLLMPCGGSFGFEYGPIVIAKNKLEPKSLENITIAIPGYMTTAYLLLRLYAGAINVVIMPFQKIMDAVINSEVDAGLLIHEGQLTYEKNGLHKIIDLGQWWHDTTNLPLPLGGNAIKRDLGEKNIADLIGITSKSIEYAIAHRNDALKYAMDFAGDMPADLIDRYVSMYVNDFSVDCGEIGKQAVKKLFELASQKQVIDHNFTEPFM